MTAGLQIDRRFQGPTGSGQGGWTAHRFVTAVGRSLAVSIRAPIPLGTQLAVVHDSTEDEPWRLVAGGERTDATIMTGSSAAPIDVSTSPVSLGAAAAARQGFAGLVAEHPVPECFSCGLGGDSMQVHAAPLDDGTGRYASDWTVPDWAVSPQGVDEGVVWAALDCAAAWYVCTSQGERTAFTVQYQVEMLAELTPGESYALVSWPGDAPDHWEGRKRRAASVAFAADGRCVAKSTSLWVAVDQ